MKTLFCHAHVISPDFEAVDGAVLVENGRVKQLYIAGDVLPQADKTIDLKGAMLLPGFIDIHTHGRSGFECTDGSLEHFKTMCVDKLSEGVTSWLPTTLTLGHDALAKTLENAKKYVASGTPGAKVPGIHLEGPYINPKCLGAQNPAFVRKPDVQEVAQLSAIFPVLKTSFAVEMEHGAEFAAELKSIGVTPSCVHSAATFVQFEAAYAHGLRNLTHFCNQMTPLHHRDIGLVGAGFMHDDVYLEMICDKIHLSPAMIALVFKLKNIDHIQLITDACQAAGMPDGEYEIGGLPLILKEGAARLASNGALAGSVLLMNVALKNIAEITGLPLTQLVKTTGFNQAKALGLSNVGKIEAGFAADFAVLNERFEVLATYVDGVARFQR